MTDSVKNQAEAFVPKQKKAYETPELVNYGTVANLTAHTNTVAGTDNVIMPNKS